MRTASFVILLVFVSATAAQKPIDPEPIKIEVKDLTFIGTVAHPFEKMVAEQRDWEAKLKQRFDGKRVQVSGRIRTMDNHIEVKMTESGSNRFIDLAVYLAKSEVIMKDMLGVEFIATGQAVCRGRSVHLESAKLSPK